MSHKEKHKYNIMNHPSLEQINIIDNVIKYNIKADCVAGSGKTTTVLHICQKYIDLTILLLTYNSKLRLETNERLISLKINNCIVHTYHSFNRKYYDCMDYTDNGLNQTLEINNQPHKNIKFDIIVLDECQDMTPLYFSFIQKILYDNHNQNIHICTLGDEKQCIYKFNGADFRFLTCADKIYNSKYKWLDCKLSTSYRITKQIANFINNCVLKREHMLAIKEGVKPKYIVCDCFAQKINTGAMEIFALLQKYKPENIFVLAPSVKKGKNDSPIRLTANILSRQGIPIYVPSSDEEKIDIDIIKGKILFCSFHQSKGLEREAVVLFGFDDSYFNFYAIDENRKECPNVLYVALTRSKTDLVILHHYMNNYIDFLNITDLKKYCMMSGRDVKPQFKDNLKIDISVLDFIKNLSSIKVMEYMKSIPKHLIKDHMTDDVDNHKLELATKTKQNDFYESVSEINSIAIISYNEYQQSKKMTIYDEMKLDSPKMNSLGLKINRFNINSFKIPDILFLANHYCAYRSGYIFKTMQIVNYDWLTEQDLNISCDRFNKVINTIDIYYEIPVMKSLKGKRILGTIDAIDIKNFIVYEFKCVERLQSEHFLQLVVYIKLFKSTIDKYKEYGITYYEKDLYLNQLANHSIIKHIDVILQNLDKFKFVLWNILDNVMYQINFDKNDDVTNIIDNIYDTKYKKSIIEKNDNFLENTLTIVNKYNMIDDKFMKMIINAKEILEKSMILNKKTKYEHIELCAKFNNKINNKIIILDTETTGYHGSRLVQLCYMIYDGDVKLMERNYIIM